MSARMRSVRVTALFSIILALMVSPSVAAQSPTPTPFVLESSGSNGSAQPQQLVFSANTDGDWDVYTYDFESGEVRSVAGGPGAQWAAKWNPQGDRVMYLSDTSGVGEVWGVNPDGSDARQHLRFEEEGHSLVSLEPGERPNRFYITVQTPMQKQLHSINAETGSDTLLLNGRSAASIDSSESARVWVTDNEAVPQVVYTVGEQDVQQWEGDAPSIARDAPYVVYQIGDRGSRRIEVRNLETEEVTQLSPDGVDSSGPTISADGSLTCWQQDTGAQVVMCQNLDDPGSKPFQLELGEFDAIWYLDLSS